MKKITPILLIIFLSLSTFFAQDKIAYKNLAVEKDGFSLDVPEGLELTFYDDKEDKSRFYTYQTESLYIFIHSDLEENKALNELLFEAAEAYNARFSDIVFRGFKANYFSFSDAEGFHQRVLLVPQENRHLIFHTVSATENHPAVERFFSTLKFKNLKTPFPVFQMVEKDSESNVEKQPETAQNSDIKEKTTQKIKIAGMGSGTGSGSGSGSGIGTGQSGQTENKSESVNLRILSKPRSGYTDIARLYNLQGTLDLRVTFLANGSIGDVSPVTRLPFGLTLSAIQAAKKMRFEPQTRNGIPVTVVKTVRFSFTIY